MKRNYIFCILLVLGIFITGFTEMSLSQTRRRPTAKRAGSTVKSSKSSSSSSRNNTSKQKPQAKRAAKNNTSRQKPQAKRAAALSSSSAKRAATSSGGTAKRAATSSTASKRAATSSSSSTAKKTTNTSVSAKRAMSRTSAAKKATAATPSTTVTKPTTTSKPSDKCPINTLIKKVVDNNGNEVFYSAKTTVCSVDENTNVMQWNEAQKDSYPLNMYQVESWIGKDNAYYLVCNNGYVENEVDGKSACVPYLDVCPLNEIVIKEGNKYIHPGKTADANNSCNPLKVSKLRQLTKEEYNANPDYNYNYAYDDINIFECPENSYSVSSNYPGIADTCKACPYMINGERVYSPKGSTSKEACRPICRENGVPVKKVSVKVGNTFVCKPCDANGATFKDNVCVTKTGYNCYEGGTRCEKILTSSSCASGASLVNNKCVCDKGLLGDGLKTGSGCYSSTLTADDCVAGATFEYGKCKCPNGYFGDGLKDNATSPYCKYFANLAGTINVICSNTYANGQGTQIPRGCIANCQTGTYWGQ